MADLRHGIGSLASGFSQGLTQGIENRRNLHYNRMLKTRNDREQEVDDTRRAVGEQQSDSEELVDPSNYGESGIPLQGPAQPGEGPLKTVNAGAKLQSLLTRAQLSGDENSLKSVQEMGMRGAMAHVLTARNAKNDPEKEMKALEAAADLIGLPGSFTRGPDGDIINPWGDSMKDSGIREATYDWIRGQFKDPEIAGRLYGEDKRTAAAEGRAVDEEARKNARLLIEQQASALAEARFDMDFSQHMWTREQVKAEMAFQVDKFQQEIGLAGADLYGKNFLRGAQAQAYIADAAYQNTRAKAAGRPQVDPAKALNFYKERNELSSMREHPLYEKDEQFRGAVGGLADKIMLGTGLNTSPEVALSVAEAIVAKENGVEDKAVFADNHDGTITLNGTVLPPALSNMVLTYERSVRNKENAAREQFRGPFPEGEAPPGAIPTAREPFRPQQPGEFKGQDSGFSALGKFLREYDWKAPGEKVEAYRNRDQ